MALFYRGNGIRVTDEAFDLRDPRRSYALRELRNAKIVEPRAVSRWRRRGRVRQLWATYHGRPVLLFETDDRLVFGQVRRALIRALERHGAEIW